MKGRLFKLVEAESAAAFLVFAVLAGSLQWFSGAYRSEVVGSDEPAHLVTGLMVRDYVAGGLRPGPLRYAEQYYVHYPKVALGHWPPLFYALEGAWTLVFPVSRGSLLALMALLAAAVGVMIYRGLREDCGRVIALGMGLVWIWLPQVQFLTSGVAPEILTVALAWPAVVRFGRFLETGRGSDAAWFGVLAAVAILTKANALALALVPPIAVLAARRFRLLADWRFWLPAAVVGVLCGPWYVFAWPMIRGEHMVWSEPDVRQSLGGAFIANLSGLTELAGAGLWALAALGLLMRRGKTGGQWIAAGALIPSVWLFHTFLAPHSEVRHLVTLLPALCLFAGAGLAWLRERLPRPALRAWGILLAAAALWLAGARWPAWGAADRGYRQMAADLLARAELRDSVFLVCAASDGEGKLIAEVAMREARPGHVVLRASKQLAESAWMGGQYQARYRTTEEIQQALESIPVTVVVIERQPRRERFPHRRLMEETLARYSGRWEAIAAHRDLTAYRLRGVEGRARGKIRVEMQRSLGRAIEW